MTIFCNEKVAQEILAKGDWIVSSATDEIKKGIEAGCHTIFIGDKTDTICPSLFAPTIDDAKRFINAFERAH